MILTCMIFKEWMVVINTELTAVHFIRYSYISTAELYFLPLLPTVVILISFSSMTRRSKAGLLRIVVNI